MHIKKLANDEHLHKAFAFFDRNQSGYIEIEDVRESLNDEIDTCSEDVISAIMHDVDTDKVSNNYLWREKILFQPLVSQQSTHVNDLPVDAMDDGFRITNVVVDVHLYTISFN